MFDAVRDLLGVRYDVDLSRITDISTAVISKMRHRTMPIGAMTLVRLHETTGIPVARLRAMMGDHRARWRE